MAGTQYTACFEFQDGACDPRLADLGFDDLQQTDEHFVFEKEVVPSSSKGNLRQVCSFQMRRDMVPYTRSGENEFHYESVPHKLQDLVYLNTMRRLVVALLDDHSMPEADKLYIADLLTGRFGLDYDTFKDDFLEKVNKREKIAGGTYHSRDELYLQDLCRTFVATLLLGGSAPATSLCTRVAQKLFITCPPLVRGESAPMATIELADANTWLLTAYYPTPTQHRLFLGVPLELESATGLRCRVTIKDYGSPCVSVVT